MNLFTTSAVRFDGSSESIEEAVIDASLLAQQSQSLVGNAPSLVAADNQFSRQTIALRIQDQTVGLDDLIGKIAGGSGQPGLVGDIKRMRTDLIGNLATLDQAVKERLAGFVGGGQAKRRIAELYERFPMLADKRRAVARTLSGGQRQILAMAIALMNAPDLLLLDEPTAGLSPRAAEELFGTIIALNKSGVAILMVEQNALEALSVSARAYVLVQGRPERDGRAADLADDPTVRDLFLGGKVRPMLGSTIGGQT
mgnify:CR=1 FL=1